MAGELRVPFTTGILIGIGETRAERLEALFAIRDLHRAFRACSGGHRSELPRQARHQARRRCGARSRRPALDLAAARLILGPAMNIQAPPNLSPGVYPRLIAAGINDWGGDLPGHPRSRQSGGAVAGDHGACRAHRRRRQASGASPADLSVLRARSCDLVGAGDRHAGAPSERRRGLGARRRLGAWREASSASAGDPRALG